MYVCVHVHVKHLIKLLHSYIYTGVHTQNVQIKIAFQQIQNYISLITYIQLL